MPVDVLDLARMSGDIPDPTKHEEAGTAGGTVRPSGARCSEAISKWGRNGFDEGLDGWAECDSGQVFEALPETPCGRQPPVRSIAAR
ncbi:hypothetical protein, partial [Acidiphilium sp.]|uniref:hypothetical protein n=1 Tax=Acidiphilium sp. TaxID=527 RepID=UPI00258FE135